MPYYNTLLQNHHYILHKQASQQTNPNQYQSHSNAKPSTAPYSTKPTSNTNTTNTLLDWHITWAEDKFTTLTDTTQKPMLPLIGLILLTNTTPHHQSARLDATSNSPLQLQYAEPCKPLVPPNIHISNPLMHRWSPTILEWMVITYVNVTAKRPTSQSFNHLQNALVLSMSAPAMPSIAPGFPSHNYPNMLSKWTLLMTSPTHSWVSAKITIQVPSQSSHKKGSLSTMITTYSSLARVNP